MQIGISTANLYPMTIEDALSSLRGKGAEVTEVFLNTTSEATPAFAKLLKERADDIGVSIRSLHSYTSCFEPYMLFSQYERRFLDGLDVFSPIFESAAVAGADYVILHGDRDPGHLTAEESIARFEALYDRGQTFGVTLLQENVVRFRASSPAFVRQMRAALGEKAQFTLDFKQCRRSGVPVEEMIDAMRGAIRHVHISDATAEHDCLMPGAGDVDFVTPLRALKSDGFDGALIIELYRHNFDQIDELASGTAFLRQLLSTL
ncbi:MAG: sugar phosphate isomerase/epimerase [Clostridia bacterium]|nr:sugar phosphate isomerase/epimerase [Clostridia bacterium]